MKKLGNLPVLSAFSLDRIHENLYMGGRTTDFQLHRAGITHVLNARNTPDTHGIPTLHLPTVDDGEPKGDYWIYGGTWAHHVLLDPSNKLFIHCAAGKHRSSGLVYTTLRLMGFEPVAAWNQIAKNRPTVRPRYVADVELALANCGLGRTYPRNEDEDDRGELPQNVQGRSDLLDPRLLEDGYFGTRDPRPHHSGEWPS